MAALVEAMDVFPIEVLVSNLHPSAEGANWRKILNGEADCLSGRREMTPYESGTRSTPALCHEQFGWLSVIKGHNLSIPKRALSLVQCGLVCFFDRCFGSAAHHGSVSVSESLEAWLRNLLVREPSTQKVGDGWF
jgi:hypothetical protein